MRQNSNDIKMFTALKQLIFLICYNFPRSNLHNHHLLRSIIRPMVLGLTLIL